MASLVILNTVYPSKLSDHLILYGHQGWEPLYVSEGQFLRKQHRQTANAAENPSQAGSRRPRANA
jgi:hypothetical protein